MNKPMRILIFSDIFFPNMNGVTTSLAQLLEELSQQGHQIMVVVPHVSPRPKVTYPNTEIMYLPSAPPVAYPGIRTGFITPRLLLQVRKFKPDVFHIVTPYSVGSMALVIARMFHKPTIGVFHGYFMEPEYLKVVGITRGTKYIRSVLWQATKLFYDGCDVVVSPSEFVKQDLIEHKFKKPIVVCRNGVKAADFRVDRRAQTAFKKKHHIQDDQVLMYVGRLSKEKNLDILLNVFADVLKRQPTAQLVVVGGGPIRDDLEAQARQMGVGQRVVFAGELPHQQLLKTGVLQLASMFVTASTSEVQPMSIIEAMFAGLPLLIAKARGNIELVQGNGYLSSAKNPAGFAQKIVSVLQNKAQLAKLSQASANLAREYTVEATAASYLDAYRKAIQAFEHTS